MHVGYVCNTKGVSDCVDGFAIVIVTNEMPKRIPVAVLGRLYKVCAIFLQSRAL